MSDASLGKGCEWWQRTFSSAVTAFLTLMCTLDDPGRLNRSDNCSSRIARVQRLTCIAHFTVNAAEVQKC